MKKLFRFQVSKYYDSFNKKDELISFKLSNEEIDKNFQKFYSNDLVDVLIEFFKIGNQKQQIIKVYVYQLKAGINNIQNYNLKNNLKFLSFFR